MRTTIWMLIFISIVSGLAAVTGIERVSFSNIAETKIIHHNVIGRVFASMACITCATAAIGCLKRRMYGWWLVMVILALTLIISAIWAAWKATVFDLPLFAMIIGAIGELAKMAFWCWLIFLWRRQKDKFQ